MASYTKRIGKKGVSWRVLVRKKGITQCATFPTKLQAQEWAARIEAEATGAHYRIPVRKTLLDAIHRFRIELVPARLGSRWEDLRLASFAERERPLCARQLSSLSEADFAAWRDRRVSEVSPSTVRRELALLGAVLGVARREWKWLSHDPLKIKKPKEPPARRRGVSQEEVVGILVHATDQVSCAFLLALETGMRAGEILSLTWGNVDLERRFLTLPKTKNGDSRQVPLSGAAVFVFLELAKLQAAAAEGNDGVAVGPLLTGTGPELALGLKGTAKHISKSELALGTQAPTGRVWTITGKSLDVLFRRARDAAIPVCPSISTLRFHDSRSEAISRLSKRLDVLDLARVVGHRNLSSLMLYYKSSAADLAKKLG